MIKSMHLKNFKAFKESAQVDLHPITLVYGENSSGKSSILQALLLMKQTFDVARPVADESVLDFRGSLVDLGGFGAAVHGHTLTDSMEVGFEFKEDARRRTNVSRRRYMFNNEQFAVNFGFELEPGTRKTRIGSIQLRSKQLNVRFRYASKQAGEGLFLADSESAANLLSFWLGRAEDYPRTSRDPIEYDQDDLAWVQGWLRRSPAETTGLIPVWSPQELRQGRPGRPVGGSLSSPRRRILQEFVYEWQMWASNLYLQLAAQFSDTHYIGPLRQAPQRITVETSDVSRQLGSRGERALRILSADREMLDSLNEALEQLEIPYSLEIQELSAGEESFDLGEISILSLRDVRSDLLVAMSDVGVGISQIIPVLLQLMMHQRSLIVVEQPELHLHPRLQARLADIVLDSIESFGNSVLLETHSEHLLLRLQRRIRNGRASASDINVLYVGQERAESNVTQMRLGKTGDLLDPWPQGFFDERLEDLLDVDFNA